MRIRESVPAKLALAFLGALIAAAAVYLASGAERQVDGTPVANAAQVSSYHDEMAAKALAEQQALEEANLASIESQVRDDLQQYFDDPATALPLQVIVSEVLLIKEGPINYEGMATMQIPGYAQHQIAVHVTADGRTIAWKIDAGALLVLLNR